MSHYLKYALKNDIFFQVNHFSQDFYNNKIGSEDN